MSKIRSKISSIEADDNVVSRALGLHPVSESEPLKPIAPSDEQKIVDSHDLEAKESSSQRHKSKAAEDKSSKTPVNETGSAGKKISVAEKTPAIISRPKHDLNAEETPRWPLWIALGFGGAWLIGTILSVMLLFGGSKIGAYSPGQFGGLAFFILFPLMLIGLVYTALKHLAGMTQQASRLEHAANELMRVDETVVRRATEMSGVVKREIDALNTGIDTALNRATTLQDVLESETEKLGETSLNVEDKTQKITKRLATEREALFNISNAFDEQMKSLSQTLDTHSENLEMSTKTAEQKIQEARLSVENTASKINQTSDLIRINTIEAATTLTGNQDEILKLSDQLKQRAEELDSIYTKHGQDLNAMIAQMQNEQDVLSESLEERLKKMRDVALSAQVSAERLTEASEAGRLTVVSLTEAAQLSESSIKNRFAEMEEVVKFSNQRAESISEKAARRVQDSLSQTRKEIARIEMDMLNLQEKLSSVSDSAEQELEIPETLPSDALEDLEIPPKKKKGALNFVPLAEDENFEVESSDFDNPETVSEPASSLVAGLRPAPTSEVGIPSAETVQQPLDETPKAVPEATLDLTIENGLYKPGKSVPATREDEASFRRSVSDDRGSRSWLKKIFGKPEEPMRENIAKPVAATTAIASAVAAPIVASRPPAQPATDTFKRVLSSQGLSPNAIVDNGCIVEAVQNRVYKSTKQMSVGVANRLGEPITLLHSLFENDQNLKDQAIDFAVDFHHSLTPINNNQDALLDRLGTEDGRLFLMCDAALNGRAV